MKKLKLSSAAFDKGEVLTRAQLKKVMGGDGSGTSCVSDFDCGLYGSCINGFCDNSFGGGASCWDGNNGGCDPDRICVMMGSTVHCI